MANNPFYNATGDFSADEITACQSRRQLLDWIQVLLADLGRMKNTRERYKMQYRQTGKRVESHIFSGNAQAIRIQGTLMQMVQTRLSQLKGDQ